MKQIKVFKTINQTNINKFLKETGGKIVSYNPIIIEYEIQDNKILPSVTHIGYGFSVQACSDSSKYDYNAILETMEPINCNSVLFFSEKIVFLADNIEKLIIKTVETFHGCVYTAFTNNSKKPIYLDELRINGLRCSVENIPNTLNEIGVPVVENHIAYNERTQAYEKIGVLKAKAIVKNTELIKDGLESIAGGLNNIATTNKQVHNGKMNRKKI